ncbi:MAG: lipoate--protein ligase family protein [Sulfurimonas sp.]|nr:lipoate--protein ligase family protein [Sulfurimonas sp.]
MAVDEALLSNFKDKDLPILRLYRWEPSLSLGRFSNLYDTLDLNTLEKQNIPFVRRMTGGGILIHGGDLSYSIVLPKNSLKGIGVKKSYRYLCEFLIHLYKKLNLHAKFANDLELHISKSNICMKANEPYDIIINSKKIGGNAQRYTKETLFQHGSIPINLDTKLFKNIFLEDIDLKNLTTLNKIGKNITYKELSNILVESFAQSFNIKLVNDTLNKIELQNVDKLLICKYNTKEWNINAK